MMDNDNRYEEILDFLKERFDQRLLLSVAETGAVLGLKTQTIYNGISKKTKRRFPIEPVRLGGPKFRIHDLARYLTGI